MSETGIDRLLVTFGQAVLAVIAAFNALGPLWPEQAVVNNLDSFDFIIVGSGVGSIVANRLTENENFRVLLVEAGGDPGFEEIFAGLFFAGQNSEADWLYKSTNDHAAVSQQGNVFNLASGKTLGGSSSINHLLYLRGNPEDFKDWVRITNDSSWSYDNILPYYKKIENVHDDEILASSTKDFHGTKGPLILTREPHESANKYRKAFVEAGQRSVLDINGNDTVGYAHCQLNTGELLKQSTATSYLRQAKDRPNLHVLKNSFVTKILFHSNKTAYGVNILLENNESITVTADKEVILCAGAFNSPQLLQLSGIGEKDLLESLNIPVISDLPVGKNLQDHTAIPLVHSMEYSLEISELPKLTKIFFPFLIGNAAYNSSVRPEYQSTNLIFVHDAPYLNIVCGTVLGYKNEYCDTFKSKSIGRNTLFTFLANLHPESTGYVRINTTDPTAPPVITMGFLTNKKDVENFANYIIDFLKVQTSTYFQKVKAKLVDLDLKECKDFEFLSTDFWKCYVEHTACSIYHYTSTCPMGTVLDSQLNVKGVQKLRVVDASALPNIPSGNPLATIAMVAEKASDMIKEAYRTSTSKLRQGHFSGEEKNLLLQLL